MDGQAVFRGTQYLTYLIYQVRTATLPRRGSTTQLTASIKHVTSHIPSPELRRPNHPSSNLEHTNTSRPTDTVAVPEKCVLGRSCGISHPPAHSSPHGCLVTRKRQDNACSMKRCNIDIEDKFVV